MPETLKILIIRNDKLGDFMLAWPAFSLLKKQFPNAEITALVPEYTAEIAKRCQWIDKILIDEKHSSSFISTIRLTKSIKQYNYDLSISLFSEMRTSIALFLAGVPTRVGPATKLAQIFLNSTLRQKRSKSLKPEYEYNIDLINFYTKSINQRPVQPASPPYLEFDFSEINFIRNKEINDYAMIKNGTILYIHPGTGGSAINLSLNQYAQLANILCKQPGVYLVITAGPGELDRAKQLSALLNGTKHHIHNSTGSIIDFAKFVNACDIFISGSTGPLHIAAALNRKTVAFYSARRSATSVRWQTVNDADKRISFSPNTYTDEDDMQTIDPSYCARRIISFYRTTLIK